MKCIRLVIIVCWGYMTAGIAPHLYSTPPAIEELERKAITYRLEHINQGYVRMHVIDYEPSSRKLERLYEVIFDKERVQQSRRCRKIGEVGWGEPQKIVVTPKIYIDDTEFIDTAVAIVPSALYNDPKIHSRALNVQALGMDTGGANLLHIAHVESLLNRSDRIGLTVREEQRSGLDTWRIDYKLKRANLKTEPSFTLWIAPSQGFGVVGIEVQSNRNGKLYKTMVESQLKKYPVGEIWYPSKVVKLVKQQDHVKSHQVILVEEARFGERIEDSAFSLSGLDLKPGREIVDSTSGRALGKIWDGKEMVNPSGVKIAPVIPDHHRWLLWILAVGLALMAVFYFRRVIQQRRSIPKSGA